MTMSAGAQIGADVVTPGYLTAVNASVSGTVNPIHLPKSGRKTSTVLTASGSLTASLALGPLPPGYAGSLITNLTATPKRVDVFITGPSSSTVLMIR